MLGTVLSGSEKTSCNFMAVAYGGGKEKDEYFIGSRPYFVPRSMDLLMRYILGIDTYSEYSYRLAIEEENESEEAARS